MEVSIDTIVPIVLFIIGWVFAAIDNGWRSPVLWVTSAIAVSLFIQPLPTVRFSWRHIRRATRGDMPTIAAIVIGFLVPLA